VTGGKSAATLSDLGISKNQSAKWQQLAAVPEDQFEAALVGPKKPTTTGINGPRTSALVSSPSVAPPRAAA
jgi:hypothetical protein